MNISDSDNNWPREFALNSDLSNNILEGVKSAFDFTAEGGINWQTRPYSKKWYWPRHGEKQMRLLLNELVGDTKVYTVLIRSDQDSVLQMRTGRAIDHVFEYLKDQTFLWMIPHNGKWIVEFSSDEYLHFDYCIPDEQTLVPLFGSCPF